MAALKKPDPVEQMLDRLAALKSEAGSRPVTAELKGFLKNRSNVVVGKAAKMAGQSRATELVPELVAAFHRFMENPSKLDKGCAATTGIAEALYELDYVEPEVYLLGIRHIQMEPSFGPPVDAAARLRGISAQALIRIGHREALDEIVSLLADEWPEARIGAVRALALNGGEVGALLIKLRVLIGESQPDVLAECFSGLLAAAPEKSLPLVAGFIDAGFVDSRSTDSKATAMAEVALLALGSSRLPEAFALLKAKCERSPMSPLRKTVLLAIAMIRSETAIEFLLTLLAECPVGVAKDVIEALAFFRNNENVRNRIESLVAHRNEKSVSEFFREKF